MKRGKVLITTSWDDGHPLDLKVCSLLKQNRLEGTIYVPVALCGKEAMSTDTVKAISENFEIGSHTYNDIILTLANGEIIDEELEKSREALEMITRKNVISFCYPAGEYNKDIVRRVKKAHYRGGRTTKVFRTAFSEPYECHTTVHAADKALLARGKHIISTEDHRLATRLLLTGDIFSGWDVIAKRSLDYVLENGGIWHMWGHSWEIDQNNEWSLLKDVLEYTSAQGRENGAEFVTNGDIFVRS